LHKSDFVLVAFSYDKCDVLATPEQSSSAISRWESLPITFISQPDITELYAAYGIDIESSCREGLQEYEGCHLRAHRSSCLDARSLLLPSQKQLLSLTSCPCYNAYSVCFRLLQLPCRCKSRNVRSLECTFGAGPYLHARRNFRFVEGHVTIVPQTLTMSVGVTSAIAV